MLPGAALLEPVAGWSPRLSMSKSMYSHLAPKSSLVIFIKLVESLFSACSSSALAMPAS